MASEGDPPVEHSHSSKGESSASFLRAARGGNLDKVLELLRAGTDINTSNANGLNALHLASKEGHSDVVRELLKRKANVDAATRKGNTALHIASLAGQSLIVTILVENGANVNVQSLNGFTPLYMAAQENHEDVVRFLLTHGANQALSTEDGFTPLAVALQQGHDRVVALLLENDTKGKVRLPALHIAAKKDDTKAATLLLQNDHNADVTSKSGFTPLHIAAHYGNENVAQLLIEKGANVNYTARHNISPLHVATKWGRTNMVQLLLQHGAIIDSRTRDLLTPLHCAARSGHDQVVDMLLEKGAPISAKTKNGLAPLHMAAQGDHLDSARILIYHRAPVDDVTVDYLTPLHVAAHCGHVRVAKLLLERQADPNARALNGFTPLHIACKKNRIKVVELLLKYNASIEATTESGLSPLHVASFMGAINIVIYLLQQGANPDVATVRGETPLHLAARANQTDVVRVLIRNGAKVDAQARELQTPLHIASRLGNTDIVVLLLQAGANPNSATRDQYTPLHIAAKEGQDEVAAILLDHGADKALLTKKGFTPLHLASKYGNVEVVKLLLEKGCPVDIEGKNQVTPLHVAAHYNNDKVAMLLLEHGASAKAAAKNGYTPLHIAAKKNQMDIAGTLLQYHADPNAKSRAGFTPLHLSSQEGHREMASLLIENGSDVGAKANNGLTSMHLCAQEDHVPVAEELYKHRAEINSQTNAGYTPLHVACHFGQLNMVRFLVEHGANVGETTRANFTPLHQAAQQGHNNVVRYLLDHGASPNEKNAQGQTPLAIAQRLGYVSVVETLKTVTETTVITETTTVHEDKYKPQNPEAMNETMFSESEDEGAAAEHETAAAHVKDFSDNLTQGLVDEQGIHHISTTEHQLLNKSSELENSRFAPEAYHDNLDELIRRAQAQPLHSAPIMNDSLMDKSIQNDNIPIGHNVAQPSKLLHKTFLISFLVDARGGAMRGCRHSGVRIIVPPRKASQPIRVTCRYLRKDKLAHPPPLSEGEELASRILEMAPAGAKFLGPVILEVPHFASLRDREREIVILRSDDGQHWKEHQLEATEDAVQEVLNESFDAEELAALDDLQTPRITRILTNDFPMYFAVVTRVRQEVHCVGPEGGVIVSSVVPRVQAIFPDGSLTKTIKVSVQAQPVPHDMVTRLHGNRVAVSPIVTVEPRRRKFHKPITLCIPLPQSGNKAMLTQYSGQPGQEPPTLRLLCSITGGSAPAQWEDITGTTQLTFTGEEVSFTTTVSARFWLMDCQTPRDAARMAQEVYNEAIAIPYMAKFAVFARRTFPVEGQLRVFCMTDDKEDKTLEKQEHFKLIAKSRDVEVLKGKHQFLEFAGNLVPVTKSGDQLSLYFQPFQENRLAFMVKTRNKDDNDAETEGRIAFMREPKNRSESLPPQAPICTLAITLPEYTGELPQPIAVRRDTTPFDVKYKGVFDKDLPDFVHQNVLKGVGPDWQRLARALEIPHRDIQQVRQKFPGKELPNMLKIWVHLKKEEVTPENLDNALRRIGRDDIVRSILHGEPETLSYGSESPSSKRFEKYEKYEPAKLETSKKYVDLPPVSGISQPVVVARHVVHHEESHTEEPSKAPSVIYKEAESLPVAERSTPLRSEEAEPVSQTIPEEDEEAPVSEVRTVVRTERHVHDTDAGPVVEERTITTTYEDDVAVNEHVVDKTVPLTEEEQEKWDALHREAEASLGGKIESSHTLPDGVEQDIETEQHVEDDGTIVTTTTMTSHYTETRSESPVEKTYEEDALQAAAAVDCHCACDMSAIPVVFGFTSSGELLVQGVVEAEGTSAHEVHHVESKSQFEAESWSGEHEDHHVQHHEERKYSLVQESEGGHDEDTPIASSEHFERKRTASLAAALLEIDPQGAPLIHFFHPSANTAPLLEAEEDAATVSLEIEEAGESEKIISSLLFLLREMKTTSPEKYTSAIQRLRELEAELREAGAVTPADPAVSDAVARALAAAGPGRDVQIRVNQSRHTTTTKTVYETETPGMAGLDPEKIRELHQQMLASLTSGHTDSSADSGTTQKKETAEEGFTNEDGSVVVSKKMTRVVTTTKTTLPGEGETAPESPTESLGSVKDRIAKFESLKEGDRASVTSLASSGSGERVEAQKSDRSSFERIPVDIVVTPVSPVPPQEDEEDEIAEAQEPLSPSVEEVSQAEVKSLDSYGDEKEPASPLTDRSAEVEEKKAEEEEQEQEPLSPETDRSSSADLLSKEPDSARKQKRQILEQSTTTTYDFSTTKEDRKHLQHEVEGEHVEDQLGESPEEIIKEHAVESPASEAPHHRTQTTTVTSKYDETIPREEEPDSPSAADKLKEFAKGAGKVAAGIVAAPVALAAVGAATAYDRLKREDEPEELHDDNKDQLFETEPSISGEEMKISASPSKEYAYEEEPQEGQHEPHKKKETFEHTTTTTYDFTTSKEDRNPLEHEEEKEHPEEHIIESITEKEQFEVASTDEHDIPHHIVDKTTVITESYYEESSPSEKKSIHTGENDELATSAENKKEPVELSKFEEDHEQHHVPSHVIEATTTIKETLYDQPESPTKSENKAVNEPLASQVDSDKESEAKEEKHEQPHHVIETTTITREYYEEPEGEYRPLSDEEDGHPSHHTAETTSGIKEISYDEPESPIISEKEYVEKTSPSPVHQEVHEEEQHEPHGIKETAKITDEDEKTSIHSAIDQEEPQLNKEEHPISHIVETTTIVREIFYEEPTKQEQLSHEQVQNADESRLPEEKQYSPHHMVETIEREYHEIPSETHVEELPHFESAASEKTPQRQISVEKEPTEEESDEESTKDKLLGFAKGVGKVAAGIVAAPVALAAVGAAAAYEKLKGDSDEEDLSRDPQVDKKTETRTSSVSQPSPDLSSQIIEEHPHPVAVIITGAREYDEPAEEQQLDDYHAPKNVIETTTTKEYYDEPEQKDLSSITHDETVEEHLPHYVVETTTVTKEYYEEPQEEKDLSSQLPSETFGEYEDDNHPHHVVETTTITREYYEEPQEEKDLSSQLPSETFGEYEDEHPPHHVVETTTTRKEGFHDEPELPVGSEKEPMHEESHVAEEEPQVTEAKEAGIDHPHYVIETTTITREYNEEPISPVTDQIQPITMKSVDETHEEEPEEHLPHHVVETTTITRKYHEEPQEEKDLSSQLPSETFGGYEDEGHPHRVVETTTVTKEYYEEPQEEKDLSSQLPSETFGEYEDEHHPHHVVETTTITREYHEEPEKDDRTSSVQEIHEAEEPLSHHDVATTITTTDTLHDEPEQQTKDQIFHEEESVHKEIEDYKPHHIAETVTVIKEYYEETDKIESPVEKEETQPEADESRRGLESASTPFDKTYENEFENEKEHPYQVLPKVETPTDNDELVEESVSSTGQEEEKETKIRDDKQSSLEERNEPHHIVETTIIVKEYDEEPAQEEEQTEKEGHEHHHVIETTTITREVFYDEPEDLGSPRVSEKESVHEQESPKEISVLPSPVSSLVDQPIGEQRWDEEKIKSVEETTAFEESNFDEPPAYQEKELPVVAPRTIHHKEHYEPESGTDDEESTKDKLLGFAKGVGKVAAGIVAAPVALAAVGAVAAYDKLKGDKDEEEHLFEENKEIPAYDNQKTSISELAKSAHDSSSHEEEYIEKHFEKYDPTFVSEHHLESPAIHEEKVAEEKQSSAAASPSKRSVKYSEEEPEEHPAEYHDEEVPDTVAQGSLKHEPEETRMETFIHDNYEPKSPVKGEQFVPEAPADLTSPKESEKASSNEDHMEHPHFVETTIVTKETFYDEKSTDAGDKDTASETGSARSSHHDNAREVEITTVTKEYYDEPEDKTEISPTDERHRIVETTTTVKETFYDESSSRGSPEPSEKEFAVEKELDSTHEDEHREPHHTVETTTTVREYYDEPSPVESQRELNAGETSDEEHREPLHVIDTTTTTREYYDEEPESANQDEDHPHEVHRVVETTTVTRETYYSEQDDLESPRTSEKESTHKERPKEISELPSPPPSPVDQTVSGYVQSETEPVSFSSLEKDSVKHTDSRIEEKEEQQLPIEDTMTQEKYLSATEPETEHFEEFDHKEPITDSSLEPYERIYSKEEKYQPEDESTKDKILDFAKGVGKVAAGIVAAPVALAAVGAVAAYEKLKGESDEEENIPEEDTFQSHGDYAPAEVKEQVAPHEETESPGKEKQWSETTSHAEDEPYIIESSSPTRETPIEEPSSPGLPKRVSSFEREEQEEQLDKPHHIVETTTISKTTFYDEPTHGEEEPESFQDEHGKPHHMTESITTVKETYYDEQISTPGSQEPSIRGDQEETSEHDEHELHRIVETTKTTKEYYEEPEDIEDKEHSQNEDDLHKQRHVVETTTVAKEAFYHENSPTEEQVESHPHHIIETTTVTKEYTDESPSRESPVESKKEDVIGKEEPMLEKQETEKPHTIETTTTTKEYFYDERSDQPSLTDSEKEAETEKYPDRAVEIITNVKEEFKEFSGEHDEKPHHIVETTTTVKETFYDESPSAESAPEHHGEPHIVETTISAKYSNDPTTEEPTVEVISHEDPETHVIESTSYTSEAHYEEPSSPVVKEKHFEEAEDYQQGLESPEESDEEGTSSPKKKSIGSKIFGFAKNAGVAVVAPVALVAKGASSAYDALTHKGQKDIQGREVMHEGEERVYNFEGQETESEESVQASPEVARKTEEKLSPEENNYVIPSEEYEAPVVSSLPLDQESPIPSEAHVIESESYVDLSETATTAIKVDTVADEEEDFPEEEQPLDEETHVIPSADYHPSHHEEQIRIDSKVEVPEEEEDHIIESTSYEDFSTVEAVHEPEELPERKMSIAKRDISDEEPEDEQYITTRISTTVRESHSFEEDEPKKFDYGEEETPGTPTSTDSRIIHETPEEPVYSQEDLKKQESLGETEQHIGEPSSPAASEKSDFYPEEHHEHVTTTTTVTKEMHHFEEPEVKSPVHDEPAKYETQHHEEHLQSEPSETQHQFYTEETHYKHEPDQEESITDKILGFSKEVGKVAAGIAAVPVALAAAGAVAAYEKLKEDSDNEEFLEKEEVKERYEDKSHEEELPELSHTVKATTNTEETFYDEPTGHESLGHKEEQIDQDEDEGKPHQIVESTAIREYHEEPTSPIESEQEKEPEHGHIEENLHASPHVVETTTITKETFYDEQESESPIHEAIVSEEPIDVHHDSEYLEEQHKPHHIVETTTITHEFYEEPEHKQIPSEEDDLKPIKEVVERRHDPHHFVETTTITTEKTQLEEPQSFPREETDQNEEEPKDSIHHIVETTTVETDKHFEEPKADHEHDEKTSAAEEPVDSEKHFLVEEDDDHHDYRSVVETTNITTERTYFDEPIEHYTKPHEEEEQVQPVEEYKEQQPIIETTTVTTETRYFENPEEEQNAPVVSGITATGEPINTGLISSQPPSPAKFAAEPVDIHHKEQLQHEPTSSHQEQFYTEESYEPQQEGEEKSATDKLLGFAKGVGKVTAGIVAAPIALAAVGAVAAYEKLKGDSDEEDTFPEGPQSPLDDHHFENVMNKEERRISSESASFVEETASLTEKRSIHDEPEVIHSLAEQPDYLVSQDKDERPVIEEASEEDLHEHLAPRTTVTTEIRIDDQPIKEEELYHERRKSYDDYEAEEDHQYPAESYEEHHDYRDEHHEMEEPLSSESKLEINSYVTDVVEEATAGAVIEATEELTPRSQKEDHMRSLEELALENVNRMRFEEEEEPDHLQSPEKQSEESPSSDQDESRLIAGDDEWKVYDSTGQVIEEFSTQLTDKVIEETGSDMQHVFSTSPRTRPLVTQESVNDVSMEPEVDYHSDLQEKLDILAGQQSEGLPMVREEELDVIRESDGESEEHDPIAETAARLVDEVIETVLEEHEGPRTTASDLFYSATEKTSTKDDQYDTCVTSQEDTYDTAQGWTSQDSEYTTATSEAPSRLSEMEERTEGTTTPQAAVSPVDSDRQFVVDLDNDGKPRPMRSFTLDDETARSTPDVALQITIEEEDENEETLPTSPSGVLLAPNMDPGRPASPVPPRKQMLEEENDEFVFVVKDSAKELESETSIDIPDMPNTSAEASDDSARYTRHSSDLSSESRADTVIHKDQEKDDQSIIDEPITSHVGSTDSLDKASLKSTGRLSSGSNANAPDNVSEPIEKDYPRSQDLSPEQSKSSPGSADLSPRPESPHIEHQDLETEEGFVIYRREGEGVEGELETVEEEPEDSDSLNGGSGNSSVGMPAHLGKYKHVSSDNVSLTSLQEFERLEQLVANRGDSSLTASEIELYATGRPRSMEGSLNSLAEFEKLEQEAAHQANLSPQDEMMLSVVKEESEAEDMSIRDDDEEDHFSETELKSRPVNEEEVRTSTPQVLSPSDSLERDVISNIAILETSTDSLEPSFQPKSSDIMADSLTEYEVVPRMDSARDSLENLPMDKDSLLEGASQDPASQETHGLLSGDTVGTYQEHDDDDKDSLEGEMESMLRSYPTTLTTFETTIVAPDGSIQTISRRVETRVLDPVMSHVTFTGTESQERLNQLPIEQPIETVDTQGNVTRTLFKRQPPHSE